MKHTKIYGIALIIGTLGGIITMVFHPTGHDLLNQPDEIARRNELIATAVHVLAIISLPITFFGLLGFCRRLGLANPLVSLGLIVYGFGSIALMSAAVLSGLVGPVLTRKILEADEATKKILSAILRSNYELNQGFDKIFVVATVVAFILWSILLLKKSRFMQLTAILGFIIGVLSLVGVFSGHLRMDIHGFGAFIFAQSVWLILVAIFMIRGESRD
ncbi:MAG: hypothetical protein HC846_10645 [Blastocatellia bacterium]|nr:hypothetical protein [Blastocatellia bacterium]